MSRHGSAWSIVPVALALTLAAANPARSEARPVARWSFEPPDVGASAVAGAPPGRVEQAKPAEGKQGKSLSFEDWSVKDYLKPDPRQATRVVVADSPGSALNPAVPFHVSAWIHPVADPIFYGGIVEKGRGLGSSYGLILLRGLKVQAHLGDRHVVARSAAPITLNAWHQITLAASQGFLTLTIDGQEAARVPIPPDTKISSTEPLVIGERFTGRIDEVEISTD